MVQRREYHCLLPESLFYIRYRITVCTHFPVSCQRNVESPSHSRLPTVLLFGALLYPPWSVSRLFRGTGTSSLHISSRLLIVLPVTLISSLSHLLLSFVPVSPSVTGLGAKRSDLQSVSKSLLMLYLRDGNSSGVGPPPLFGRLVVKLFTLVVPLPSDETPESQTADQVLTVSPHWVPKTTCLPRFPSDHPSLYCLLSVLHCRHLDGCSLTLTPVTVFDHDFFDRPRTSFFLHI